MENGNAKRRCIVRTSLTTFIATVSVFRARFFTNEKETYDRSKVLDDFTVRRYIDLEPGDECVEAKRGPDASHARANVKRYVHSSKLPTRRDPTNLRIYTIRPVAVFDSICPLLPRKQARSTATDCSYLPRTACRCNGTATRVPLTPKRGNARLFRSNNTVQLPRIISRYLQFATRYRYSTKTRSIQFLLPWKL